jgi:hypothetical protein
MFPKFEDVQEMLVDDRDRDGTIRAAHRAEIGRLIGWLKQHPEDVTAGFDIWSPHRETASAAVQHWEKRTYAVLIEQLHILAEIEKLLEALDANFLEEAERDLIIRALVRSAG